MEEGWGGGGEGKIDHGTRNLICEGVKLKWEGRLARTRLQYRDTNVPHSKIFFIFLLFISLPKNNF